VLIRIPADITIVTLRRGGADLPQRWTESQARTVFHNANGILRPKANIEFQLGTCRQVVETMPTGARQDVVDEAGYHFLAAAHKAAAGIRILFIDRVARRNLGGQSRQQTRVCMVAYAADAASAGRMLAHEMGHLLGMSHPDSARRPGPGHERQVAAWMRNLMYSGALNPAAELTPAQVRQARSSELARRFGGR
jgi:hypothetical protein